jgi:hypothetical protein
MTVSTATLAEVEQLKQQQSLITAALAAMVNGEFGGSAQSAAAYIDALDPNHTVHVRTPELQHDSWYNPSTPPVLQNKPWDCSCATTAWMLQSMGRTESQDDVIAALGPSQVNPSVGLTDGSGAALAALITRLTGYPCQLETLSFEHALSLAGKYPIGLGFAGMYHWMACYGSDNAGRLLTANPSPGYDNVGNVVDRDTFNRFGPVRAIWCTGPNQ